MHFCCLAEALPPGSLMLHPNENEELEELRQDMTCDETVLYGRHQRPGLDEGRLSGARFFSPPHSISLVS